MADSTRSKTRKNALEAILPLTSAQQGMLFESVAGAERGVHVEQQVCRIDGPLRVELFERAWERVIERHAVLRAAFVWKGQDRPRQVVLRRSNFAVTVADWSDLDAAEREERLKALAEEDRRRGFVLERPPLLRMTLVICGPEHHHLVWTHHHILMDGWCQPLLFDELLTAYTAFRHGREPELARTRPYRDYFRWLEGQDEKEAATFWRKQLAGFTAPVPLGRPTETLTPVPAEPYGDRRLELERDLSEALGRAARHHRVTLGQLVQGAWALLLARYAGTRDVVFGVTVSGRPPELSGIERTVGLFINTLPLRLSVEGSLGLWLAELKARTLDLGSFEHTPGRTLREVCEVPADRPLFESLLVYENYPTAPPRETDAGDLRVSAGNSHGARTQYALTLLVQPGERLAFELVYDTSRLSSRAVDRLVMHLRTLLEALATAGEEAAVDDLLIRVPEAEIPSFHAARRLRVRGKAARYPTEERVLAVWRRVLGVEGLGIDDDFFAIGGHSLLAAELVDALRQELEMDLPLRTLFVASTVEAMAKEVEELRREGGEGALEALPEIVPNPAAADQPFPLTDVQEAYWVGRSSAVELGNVATHSYSEIEGRDIDLERLEQAWNLLVLRHGMLRAIVLPDGRQQVLAEVPRFEIPVNDLQGLGASEGEAALEAVREEMSHQVLPTDRWPLFDIRASLLADGVTRLHLSFDLLIGDGWSWRVLGRELFQLYADPSQVFEDLELSFRDCVLAERVLRESAHYDRARNYWRERLATLPPAPGLPLAKKPRDVERPEFRRRASRLEKDLWSRLKERAARRGLTSSGVLLAAFAEVLRSWSKEPELSLNLTLFNRLSLHRQIHHIVGDFTSLTLLAVKGWRLHSFEERARSLQERLWDDLDHRAMSGVAVLRELTRLRKEQAAAGMPVVFTSTLGLDAMQGDERDAEGLDAEALPDGLEVVYSIGQTPQVWLDHQVSEHRGTLHYVWDAVEELFPEGLLDDLFASYQALLKRLASSEDSWTASSRVELLPTAWRRTLAEVNDTAADLLPREPHRHLLHGLFQHSAEAAPQRPAVITGERTVSYGELQLRARHLAAALRPRFADRQGQRNPLVAVVMEKGWQQVPAVLGILEAGAAYLPVDAALPTDRLHQTLEQGGVELVVTTPAARDAVEWPAEISFLLIESEVPQGPLPPAIDAGIEPMDLAYVIFTSGSTGKPKGVMIDHRGAVNTVLDLNDRYGVGPEDRVLGLSALNFDLSVYDIFGLLATGGALVLPEASAGRDPGRWAELLNAHRVTLWNTVPALLQMLVEYQGAVAEGSFPYLRQILLSGDWIPVDLPGKAWRLAPKASVESLGGATEASIWSILYPIDEVDPSWRSIPYGKPMRNQEFHVLDALLEPRPPWVPGELYIGGTGVALGYFGDEERTEMSFLRSPSTGKRLYRTGDLGRWLPDGNIEFLGREDHQVKIRGHRIELGEIESVLEAHPRVSRAVVSAVGEQVLDRRLVAWAVLEEGNDGRSSRSLEEGAAVELPTVLAPVADVAGNVLDGDGLGALLSLLAGRDVEGQPLPRYRYGSAGSLYPVQTYLWVREGSASGLPAGAYYYHPRDNALLPVGGSGALLPEHFEGVDRRRFEASSANIFLVLQKSANGPVYGPWAEEFGILEGGYMREMLRSAPAPFPRADLGLGDEDALSRVFALEPSHLPISGLALGVAPDSEGAVRVPRLDALAHGEGIGELQGPLDRLDWKLGEPGLRRDLEIGRAVSLPERSADAAGLGERRSHRRFDSLPVDLEALAGALSRAVTPNLEVLVYGRAGGIEGLPAGTFRYRPEGARLVCLRSGVELPVEIHGAVNREAFASSAFSLFLVAREGSPAALDLGRALLDAGETGQRLMAAGDGLGFCPIGSLDVEALRPFLGLGPDDLVLHSFVGGVPMPAAGAFEADLLAYVGGKLPDYMVPGALRLLDSLPLTANGKVDRKNLPAIDGGEAVKNVTYEAPRNTLEGQLANILGEVLGLERVGVHDNFFELGGNSVHLVRVHSQLRQLLGREVPLVEMFKHTTISELARFLEGSPSGPSAAEREEERDAARRAGRNRLAARRRRAREDE